MKYFVGVWKLENMKTLNKIFGFLINYLFLVVFVLVATVSADWCDKQWCPGGETHIACNNDGVSFTVCHIQRNFFFFIERMKLN